MFQTVRFIQTMSLTFGLFTQVSGSGPLGPLVQMMSLTFGLFTQVSGSGPLGPLVGSNSFSYCKVDQKKMVAFSQMFSHVQLHIHWMHLLNTRIYR